MMIRMPRTTHENLEAISSLRFALGSVRFSPVLRLLFSNRGHHHGDGAVKGPQRFFHRRWLFVGKLTVAVAHVACFGDACPDVIVQIACQMQDQVSNAISVRIGLAPELFIRKRVCPLVQILGDILIVRRQPGCHRFVDFGHERKPLLHRGRWITGKLLRHRVYSHLGTPTIAFPVEKSRICLVAFRSATLSALLHGAARSCDASFQESVSPAFPQFSVRGPSVLLTLLLLVSETEYRMARYSAFLGRRVEVQYRAGEILLPASGTFVADSGRSIFLEQNFEQRGQHKHFRWEIPYQYLVRIEEKPDSGASANGVSARATPEVAPEAPVAAELGHEPLSAAAAAGVGGAPGLLPLPRRPKTA